MRVYQVGGAVRDKLLGQPNQDRDWVVVEATPTMMLALGYTQVGRDFPVFLHPLTHEEYALARTERKIKPGYKGFEVHAAPEVTLEDDLRRRDLTINAMAEDEEGRLIDPFQGQADLQKGLLRHVSPAFVEDPVRILRVARFAARWNFTVVPETLALMTRMVTAGEVDALIPERVWQEIVRALGETYPHRFFEVLRSCQALAKIFPALDPLFDLHLSRCLQQARQMTADPQILFAVLTHDLGNIEAWCHRYRVPTHYRELATAVLRYHSACHQFEILEPEAVLKILEHLDAFRRPQRFEQFLLACQAAYQGRFENHPYPQADLFRRALAAARSVEVGAILTDGFIGEAISQELHRRRVNVLMRCFPITAHSQIYL